MPGAQSDRFDSPEHKKRAQPPRMREDGMHADNGAVSRRASSRSGDASKGRSNGTHHALSLLWCFSQPATVAEPHTPRGYGRQVSSSAVAVAEGSTPGHGGESEGDLASTWHMPSASAYQHAAAATQTAPRPAPSADQALGALGSVFLVVGS
eukprot:364818-Chlamydomonas_euryale.AAC.3